MSTFDELEPRRTRIRGLVERDFPIAKLTWGELTDLLNLKNTSELPITDECRLTALENKIIAIKRSLGDFEEVPSRSADQVLT